MIPRNTQQWLAPYAYAAVGLVLLAFVAHLVLRFLQTTYDFLWYRQAISWRRISLSRKSILQTFPFYKKLSPRYQKQFEHRVACFLKDKSFKHRHGKPATEEQQVLLSSIAVMLTFGRRNYLMEHLDTILLFDEPFESVANSNLHKGEYNPKARVLALSWSDVIKGMLDTTDNFHLALHEFTHVIHLESERSSHIDAMRYHKYHQLILVRLMDVELRKRMEESDFFRAYAFTNQYEFMAVLTEYFFESPTDFEHLFPELFQLMKTALLYKKEWI